MKEIRGALERKLSQRSAKMAVLGMGYVGLPLAVVFAEAGFEVLGIDPDSNKIKALAAGESYIGDVSSEQVTRLVKAKKLHATIDRSGSPVLRNGVGTQILTASALASSAKSMVACSFLAFTRRVTCSLLTSPM